MARMRKRERGRHDAPSSSFSLQINPPTTPIGGGEMTSLLRTFATSCCRALSPPSPDRFPRGPLLVLLPRVLAHFDVPKSKYLPRPHILKMSAPIYGSPGEARRFRPPRIQIVLFFGGFSSPENRVARLRVLLFHSLPSPPRENKQTSPLSGFWCSDYGDDDSRFRPKRSVRREIGLETPLLRIATILFA